MTFFERLNQALLANLESAGIYEHCSHYILQSEINDKSVVIDLGANVGNFYSLMYGKYNCTCFAVEASPELYANLPILPKLKTYHYAIGKNNGKVKFFLSNESEANSLKAEIATTFGIIDAVTVEMVTIESFLIKEKIPFPVDVLKIDIEGAEVDVINLLPVEMLHKIKQIPVEFHDFLGLTGDYLKEMHLAIKKLKENNFKIIRLSEYDYRALLCFNQALVHLKPVQKLRLNIIHPLILKLKLIHSSLSHFIRGDKKSKK